MISYSEAINILQREIAPLGGRECAPGSWLGGVTVGAIDSPIAVPSFDNAAMDGFALRSADTRGATPGEPVELDVWGSLAAGTTTRQSEAPAGAAEIMTGAVMPQGCDAVIPIERVEVVKGSDKPRIRVAETVAAGRNVRRAGEDYAVGQTVVGAATLIEPHHVMGLVASGLQSARLRPPPRISVITTGTELVATDAPQPTGTVQDANGPYLCGVVERVGARLAESRRVPDKRDAIANAIAECAGTSDLVITTGGVSAGRYDLVPSVITSTGGEILFHKVSVRPGKPVLCARLENGALFIGLPGNPIAAAVGMRFIAIPAIRMLRGLPTEKFHAASTTTRISKRSEFCFFGKARARVDDTGKIQVELLPGQESFKISPLTAANCWAIVAQGTEEIAAGDLIEVAPLYPGSFLQ